jgi:hypothetical protein
MEITKKRIIEKIKKKNMYSIIVNYMHGDADGYDEQEFYFDENTPSNMLSFTQMIYELEAVGAMYPHGRGGGDEYGYYGKFIDCENNFGWTEDIPGDITNEGGEASYDGYSVIYFDEHGARFDVTIKFDTHEKEMISKFPAVVTEYNDRTYEHNTWLYPTTEVVSLINSML